MKKLRVYGTKVRRGIIEILCPEDRLRGETVIQRFDNK